MRNIITMLILIIFFILLSLSLRALGAEASSLNSPNATSTPNPPLYCPPYPAPYPAADDCYYEYLPAIMQGGIALPTSTPNPPPAAWLVKEAPTSVPD